MTVKYKILESNDLANEANLNEIGKDNWILITIVSKDNKFYYYFKQD